MKLAPSSLPRNPEGSRGMGGMALGQDLPSPTDDIRAAAQYQNDVEGANSRNTRGH